MQRSVLMFVRVVAIALLIGVTGVPTAQAVISSSLDQTCSLSSTADSKVSLTEGGGGSQYFTPTKNRLTKVVVKINGDGAGSLSATIILDTTYVGFSDTVAEPDGLDKVVTFRFDSLALTPGTTYRLAVLAGYGNEFAQWQYKNACYAGGDALVSGMFQAYDFLFATYGYDEEAPPAAATDEGSAPAGGAAPAASDAPATGAAESSASSTSSATPPTSSSAASGSTGSTPSSQAAAGESPAAQPPPADSPVTPDRRIQRAEAIEPPNDLTGEFRGAQVTLRWQASKTTDIDGYAIYRSEQEAGEFQRIGQVGSDQLQFSDGQVTAPKQYFYSVKAYKGNEESSPTNTLEMNTVVADSASRSGRWSALSPGQRTLLYSGGLLILLLLGYLTYRRIKSNT